MKIKVGNRKKIILTACKICFKSPKDEWSLFLTVKYRGFKRMAKVELGLKRTCLSCDMRFYDFKRSPIICPGCGTEFDPENLLKGRKSRAAPKSAAKADVSDDADDLDETDFDDEDIDVAVTKDDDDDDDIDFDEDDVDVDDTDGPGIIQDDITDGDELLPNLDNKDDQ
ncbi:FYDLN acid domain-containing protein [Alphaproteobacteria bacterium]|nr:FYDLN acid domain-containing protein [Alphaproteobacteria bacterium]MDA9022252.1 FYDLN acid domain-containing protein [Alphaproteobacteria bacterium]